MVWQRGVGRTTVSGLGARRGQVSAAQIVFFTICGRTDLRIGVSGAKFDAEVDFEVHFVPAPPKLDKNLKKLMISLDFFQNFRQVFEEMEHNGPQNQLPRQILLQIHLS